MAKSTMGTKLPRKLEQKMQIVGEQIKLARLRRNLSVAQVAERATCSPLTVSRIEKGVPTVAIGIYLRVLYALQLDDAWVGKIPWRGERLPTPVFLPGEFHGLYSPWGHKESDTTE